MSDAETLINFGLEQYRSGDLSKAESIFEQILEQQPNHPGALNVLGVLAQQQGRISQALEYFERVVTLLPQWAEAWYNLGNARRDRGDLTAACNAYRQAISLYPEFGDALNNLGLVLSDLGAYDEVVAVFRSALIACPDNPNIVNNLSSLLLRMGRSTEAAVLLARTGPEDAIGHNNRCLLLRSAGHLSEAAVEAHLAIDLNPSFVEAYNSLGLVLMDGHDLTGASAAFEKALSIRQDFLDARINLGAVRHLQGNLDEAFVIYDRLLALYPGDARLLSHRGLVLLEMNRFDEAMSALEEAIALAPRWPEAYVSMARLMVAMGRLDTAVLVCNKALAIDANCASAQQELLYLSIMTFLGDILNQDKEKGERLSPETMPLVPRALRLGMFELDNLLTAKECAKIVAASTGLPEPPTQRTLVPPPPDFAVLPLTEESQWIYRRIGAWVRYLNQDLYRFDLSWGEPFRLIQWVEGGRGESWRAAASLMSQRPIARKLSLIIQLNDEREFEGGAIELWQSDKPIMVPRCLGEGLIFPAPALHRIVPVTRGLRQVLLCNFNGPRFR